VISATSAGVSSFEAAIRRADLSVGGLDLSDLLLASWSRCIASLLAVKFEASQTRCRLVAAASVAASNSHVADGPFPRCHVFVAHRRRKALNHCSWPGDRFTLAGTSLATLRVHAPAAPATSLTVNSACGSIRRRGRDSNRRFDPIRHRFFHPRRPSLS